MLISGEKPLQSLPLPEIPEPVDARTVLGDDLVRAEEMLGLGANLDLAVNPTDPAIRLGLYLKTQGHMVYTAALRDPNLPVDQVTQELKRFYDQTRKVIRAKVDQGLPVEPLLTKLESSMSAPDTAGLVAEHPEGRLALAKLFTLLRRRRALQINSDAKTVNS